MNIIYIRTSTEDQEPENQIKSCENLFNEEYELFQDKQSAFKDNKEREGFEKAKKLIKLGKVSRFIVWDWDRIFRNQKKLVEFFKFCEVYKCQIHSVNQQYFDDFYKIPAPFDEIVSNLVLNLMGWLAEDESKKKSDRVKLAVRKREGKPTKSYKGNKWGRKSMHTNKTNRIKKLREEGLSYREIADKENVSIGKISQILSVHKSSLKNKEKKPIGN
jgi:DNA invertase Pin-like site-specific DNA recombinase